MTEQLRTACAYIRVSDERQDEYSPESQKKRIFEYARTHHFMLTEQQIFYDDGISARSARNRTEFQRMIALAKSAAHPFEAILVWKFSRFARNQEESIVYKNLLRKSGVEVISVSEPVTDDPFGALIERIIEWMDEYYLINLSAEVRRGMTEKASRGEAMGRAVFGYVRSGKTYVPSADADTVRQLFAFGAAGSSLREIAQWLNAQGVRTARGRVPDSRWVAYLLNNPVYIGKIRWCTAGRAADPAHTADTLLVPGLHPPIVDEALFTQVQQRMRQNRKKFRPSGKATRADWLFRGLIHCSACGAALVRSGSASPSVQCSRYAKGRCGVSHALSCTIAERVLLRALQPLTDGIHIRYQLDLLPERMQWEKQRDRALLRLNRASEAYQNGVDTLDEYRRTKAEVMETIRYCTDQLATASEPDSVKFDGTLTQFLSHAKIAAAIKETVLQMLIDHIVYHKSQKQLEVILRVPDKSPDAAGGTGWGAGSIPALP